MRTWMIAAMLITAPWTEAGIDTLFYHPEQHLYGTPADDGFSYEEVSFTSADGTRLSGWFIPATGKAIGTVVHFHGNAQNMSSHYSFVSWLPANGFNLFLFDYRGYGKSGGKPSRKGVYEDSVAAMNHIKSRTDIDQNRIVVFGQSIGGANALTVIGKNHFEGLCGIAADSAFSSYKSVACDHAGFFKPLAYCLIGNALSPQKYVENIAPTPLLIIHGTNDRVVAFKHGEKLYGRAKDPRQFWKIKDGGHICALGEYKAVYAPRLLAQFTEWVEAANPPE